MGNQNRRVADPELVAKRLPQIIKAAIRQFGRNGFHSTTIQDIAKAAGISVGMIYQYVGDKEELLYLSMFEVVEHHLREVAKAVGDAKSPLERYVAVVEALTRVIDERRAEAVLGYRESHSMNRGHLEYVMKREREIGEILIDCIEECVKAGVFRKVNAEMLMYQSIILAHNWALNAWRFRQVMSVDEYLKEGLNSMLRPVLVDFETQIVPGAGVRAPSPTRTLDARHRNQGRSKANNG
jgi:TetR/AcrR family transcriptional regulator, cholesterol catabolism regulator